MTTTISQMACSLDGKALSDRKAFFRAQLLPRALRTSRIENGLRIVFPKDPLLRAEIQAFIALERQCCAFLTFELAEDPVETSQLLLTIKGPSEAHAVLRQIESAFVDGEDETSGAYKRNVDGVLKYTGIASSTAGIVCLLLCEVPLILTLIGLGGVGAWLAQLQPGLATEASASVLILAGSMAYIVWRRRTGHTRSSS